MNTNETNLLVNIAQNLNNRKLTDQAFRQMVANALKEHQPSQDKIEEMSTQQANELVDHSINLNSPLLHAIESNMLVVYTHEQNMINSVKRALDAHTNPVEKEVIILDLVGFEDAESEQFDTLITLFGYENAEVLAGNIVQLVYLRESF